MARILLAEDDAAMRGFLVGALKSHGHEVAACADGKEALGVLERRGVAAFDLLLTDIIMPGLDGIALAQSAGAMADAAKRDLKVMFITGFAAVLLTPQDGPNGGEPAYPDQDRGCAGHPNVLGRPFHLRRLPEELARLFPAPAAALHTED
jgi:two-component system cell cycle response regulator CpdR